MVGVVSVETPWILANVSYMSESFSLTVEWLMRTVATKNLLREKV